MTNERQRFKAESRVQVPATAGMDDRATQYSDTDELGAELPYLDDRATQYAGMDGSAAQPPSVDDRATQYDAIDDRSTQFEPARPASHHSRTARTPVPSVGSRVLNGQYELLKAVAGGAQAQAFRGRRILDDAQVFIKVQTATSRGAQSFAKQIALRDTMLRLRHPNLLSCYDLGLEGNSLCEVYELLDGEPLSEWLTAHRPLADTVLRDLAEQLAAGIHGLHVAVGLAHRDIKPDNIIVTHRGGVIRCKIVDYGTVTQLDSLGATATAGTPLYAPPEFLMRAQANTEQLRAWDWWGLGRILQEALDGHPFDRLLQHFTAAVGDANPVIVQRAIIDDIMFHGPRSKYRIHAGMVELTERNPAAARWLPLLRGLLTTHRAKRWGHSEVQRWLRGEEVPESYTSSVDVEGFLFADREWELSALALHLAAPARASVQASCWKQAVELLRKGSLILYVERVLHDEDLRRSLAACQRVEDADVATGLALSRLAGETKLPPAICGEILGSRYVLAQLDDRSDATEARLRSLISPECVAILQTFNNDGCRELVSLAERAQRLRERLQELQIHWDERVRTLARVLMKAHKELLAQLDEQRTTALHHTRNERLQAVFRTPAAQLSELDTRAVFLSILSASQNEYVSVEAHAVALNAAAVRARDAWIARKVAPYFGSVHRVLHGNYKTSARTWMAIAAAVILYRAESHFILGLGAAVLFGIVYACTAPWLRWAARRDLSKFVPNLAPASVLDAKTLLDYASKRAPDLATATTCGQRLRQLNAELAALPGGMVDKYCVPAPRLRRSNIVHAAQMVLLGLLVFGGWKIPDPDDMASSNQVDPVQAEAAEKAEAFSPKPAQVESARPHPTQPMAAPSPTPKAPRSRGPVSSDRGNPAPSSKAAAATSRTAEPVPLPPTPR